ncbi:MAG: aldehyde dehydrogenase family protein [Terriglobales bacterium]
MSFQTRFEKVLALADALEQNKERIVEFAVKDLQFTVKDSVREVELAISRLPMYDQARPMLEPRVHLGGAGACVPLMLSYNGSAWLNTAITSIYMVGNRVRVKFSSRGRNLMALTESIYRPIFGDDISFYSGRGRSFMEESLRDPQVAAVVVFGFDENILPYENAFRESGKKLIFEGPGQDPFIVLPDASLESTLDDLVASKFMYSGQTCTAPKRIFIHETIYDEVVDRLAERARSLVVGDPADSRTDISPVASPVAVERVRAQLADAVAKGAIVVCGGNVEGLLVAPTVVRNCTDDMLGMREEVFAPVAFTSSFSSVSEVLTRARNHKYGLRAAVHGTASAEEVVRGLKGAAYCHPVRSYTYGKFGTVAHNQPRSESWKGAFVTKAVGGYGLSGWIWETVGGRFRIKQGPKLFSLETSALA